MLWWQDNELLSAISSGHVAYELARPYNLYLFWYMRLLAVRLSNLTLRCLPVLSISLILPKAYRMLPPAGTSEGFLFVLSMSLSLLLVTALSMFIYILTFVTLTSVGSRLLIAVTAEFLMGSVIPIPFMPDTLQKVLNYLPFRYLADLPLRLYSGNIASIDATRQISVQVLWIITLWITGYISFQKVLKRVIIQGG
jgi:ABC-2 type transport system permease protein